MGADGLVLRKKKDRRAIFSLLDDVVAVQGFEPRTLRI